YRQQKRLRPEDARRRSTERQHSGQVGPCVVTSIMRSAIHLFGLVAAINLSAANWPKFRGPKASGVDTNALVPTRWDVEQGENIRWRTPLPGLAHASPIIWNDRVYVTTATRPGKADLKVGLYGDIASANGQEPHQWRLIALDKATGKVLW